MTSADTSYSSYSSEASGLRSCLPPAQTAIQRFTTSLPTWAALSNATWPAEPRFDAAADPLPALRSFNDSAMARVHRSRPRLPSGAFGQNGACNPSHTTNTYM